MGFETVDRLIQNQKLRIVHNGKSDGKPLLHTKGILRKKLFIFVRQSYQIESVFDGMTVWYAPQSGKDTQVLCAGQYRDKSRGTQSGCRYGAAASFRSPARAFPRF